MSRFMLFDSSNPFVLALTLLPQQLIARSPEHRADLLLATLATLTMLTTLTTLTTLGIERLIKHLDRRWTDVHSSPAVCSNV